MSVLDPAALAELRAHAETLGLLRLGAASVDDPRLEPSRAALAAYLDRGAQGEMEFMARTRTERLHARAYKPWARSVLIAAVPYAGEDGPVARYAQGRDYHTEVHHRLERLLDVVRARYVDVEAVVCVDTKPLLERSFAMLAGLGFLGKHGCLILPGLGSRVVLGALLTSLEWSAGEELRAEPVRSAASRDGAARAAHAPQATQARASTSPTRELAAPWDACGACTACLDACPTAAFDAPGRLDPRRCISYLTIEHRGPIPAELHAQMGVRIAGCDACQDVCPYNQGTQVRARVPAQSWIPARPRPLPDLVTIATMGANQHRQLVKHSALNRIPRRTMQRNALIALANRERPLDEEERTRLTDGLVTDDPQVAEHAARALARK